MAKKKSVVIAGLIMSQAFFLKNLDPTFPKSNLMEYFIRHLQTTLTTTLFKLCHPSL